MTASEVRARTLTFLFTDIEGSTRLWEAHPDAMRPALERHDAILTEAITAAGGDVVKTTGDGVMAVFASSGECLAACVASQLALQAEPWGQTGPLLVRMGIHTGTVPDTGVDFHGPAVNRTARIMSAGHGGQILLSSAAQALLADELPEAWSLLDLGEHRLKDIGRPERVYQLVHPGLRTAFPELATVSEHIRALPADDSLFVGRRAELDELAERLGREDVRLLTLIGPGGIGKTRLALRVAQALQASYEAVVFVDLSAARDTESVLLAIAREVGLPDRSGQAQLERLVAHLRERAYLLLLDNFEQVAGSAPAVAQLLSESPRLRVLVTSREPLHLRGEHRFSVPPLELPAVDAHAPSLDSLGGFAAIQLFVERARLVRPDFGLTDDNAATVLEICRRLDGLPLAIELATARIGLFSPQALLDRLDSRLRLLKSGARDLPERQQTLRATITWSHQLLEPSEQALFSVLAVFTGAGIEDLEAVLEHLPAPFDVDAIEGVASLVDKSLLRQFEVPSGTGRFSMLETIREFALERLDEDAGYAASVRQAHAEHFAELAARQAQQLDGPGRHEALDRLATERENLAACWHFWVAARDKERLEELVDALWPLYQAKGWFHDTIGLANDMLEVVALDPLTPERKAAEITLRVSLARTLLSVQGHTDEAEQAYQHAYDLLGEDVEARQQLSVLNGLAMFHMYRAEFVKSADLGRRMQELAEANADVNAQVHGQLVHGSSRIFMADVVGGLAELGRAIELFDAHGYRSGRYGSGMDPRVAVLTTSALGSWLCGDLDRSLALGRRALDMAAAIDHRPSLVYARFHTGLLHLWRGEPAVAQERALGVLDAAEGFGLTMWQAIGTCLLGAAVAGEGRAEEGLEQIREGLGLYQSLTTPPVFWPNLLFMHAGACLAAGHTEEGLALIDEALAMAGPEAGSPLASELLILRGDLLAASGPEHDEAEATWVQAFEVATDLGVAMSRLRSALRLASVTSAGHPDAADRVDMLRQAHAAITGGTETADMVAAGRLLDQTG